MFAQVALHIECVLHEFHVSPEPPAFGYQQYYVWKPDLNLNAKGYYDWKGLLNSVKTYLTFWWMSKNKFNRWTTRCSVLMYSDTVCWALMWEEIAAKGVKEKTAFPKIILHIRNQKWGLEFRKHPISHSKKCWSDRVMIPDGNSVVFWYTVYILPWYLMNCHGRKWGNIIIRHWFTPLCWLTIIFTMVFTCYLMLL